MRIAQVAPLVESVPPRLYGGTERVVSNLVEELVRQGHDVTLFASGDSRTSARLVPGSSTALRLGGCCQDFLAPHVYMLEQVLKRADEFDVVHFHIAQLHLPIARRALPAHVTTLHGRLDLPELKPLYEEFSDVPCVSISEAQRAPLPQPHWVATVHHGLPPHLLPFQPRRGSYLAFLGRISPEKRVDRAIAIARACEQRLRIAAKVDPADIEYFEREIKPLLDHPLIEFIGEIGDAQKAAFLGNARALLFPIDWPEPFGLVMIESMAAGTPVVAFRCGSVPEIVDEGVSGIIVESVEEAVARLPEALGLDRRAIRRRFEERFSAERMARDYVRLYQRIIGTMPARPAVLGLVDPPLDRVAA